MHNMGYASLCILPIGFCIDLTDNHVILIMRDHSKLTHRSTNDRFPCDKFSDESPTNKLIFAGNENPEPVNKFETLTGVHLL